MAEPSIDDVGGNPDSSSGATTGPRFDAGRIIAGVIGGPRRQHRATGGQPGRPRKPPAAPESLLDAPPLEVEPGEAPPGNAPRLSLGGMLGPTKPQTKAQKAAAVKTAAERASANVVQMANFTARRYAGPEAVMSEMERITIETTLQEILEDSETFAKQSKAVSPFVLLAATTLWLFRVGTLWAGKRQQELKAKAEAKAATASVATPQYQNGHSPPPPEFDMDQLYPRDDSSPAAARWEEYDRLHTIGAEPMTLPNTELFSGPAENQSE